MSVLFNALNKAARDYRVQKAPVIVPLLPPSPVSTLKKRAALFVALPILVFVMTSGFIFLGGDTTFVRGTGRPAGIVHTTAEAPLLKNTRKIRAEEPLGITLSADSGESDPNDMMEPVVAEGEAVAAPQERQAERGEDSYARAKKAAISGDWERALENYDVVLKYNSANKAALQGKIYVLEQRGQEGDMVALDRIVAAHPAIASAHAARAHILTRQQKTLESLHAWEKAVALEPTNRSYRLGLAILNDKLGREAAALDLYRSLPKPLPSEAQRRLDYLASHQLPDNAIAMGSFNRQ
ncbi:MAG TPA: hypothetical protein DCY07_06335 [Rhodospirillaceae bacterium]|nr:hypothetical protein [Rhodospirillaceae bacterium]